MCFSWLCHLFESRESKTLRHFNDMLWRMVTDGMVRTRIASYTADDRNPIDHPDNLLMRFESWVWLINNESSKSDLLITIAADIAGTWGPAAGDLPGAIKGHTDAAAYPWGPWDLGEGDQYDSGNCLMCGEPSHYMIKGCCPIHYNQCPECR